MPTVLSRYEIRKLGHVVVVEARAKRGDTIVSGDRRWVILGIETFCIANPPLPWGFLLGETAPEVGAEITMEKGPDHETTPWPMS